MTDPSHPSTTAITNPSTPISASPSVSHDEHIQISQDDRLLIKDTLHPLFRDALASSFEASLTSDTVTSDVQTFLQLISSIRQHITNQPPSDNKPSIRSWFKTLFENIANFSQTLHLTDAVNLTANIAALFPCGGSTLSRWLTLLARTFAIFETLAGVGEYATHGKLALQEVLDSLDVALEIISLYFVRIGSPTKLVAEAVVVYIRDMRAFFILLNDTFPSRTTDVLSGKRSGVLKRLSAISKTKKEQLNFLRCQLVVARMKILTTVVIDSRDNQINLSDRVTKVEEENKLLQRILREHQEQLNATNAFDSEFVQQHLSIPYIPEDVLLDLDKPGSDQSRLLHRLLHAHEEAALEAHSARSPVRLITVVMGMGGLGKSTLSALCSDWIKTSDSGKLRFPDGVFWIQGNQTWTETDVVKSMWDVIVAVSDEPPKEKETSISRVRDLLKTALAKKSVLLVVDDVWKASLVKPFVHALHGANRDGQMSSTGIAEQSKPSMLLLTTRNRAILETAPSPGRIKMELMKDTTQAREILLSIARQQALRNGSELLNLDSTLVDEVVSRAGGLPLALRIAGSMIEQIGLRDVISAFSAGIQDLGNESIENDSDYSYLRECFQASFYALSQNSRVHQKDRFRTLYELFGVFSPKTLLPLTALAKMWNLSERKAKVTVVEFSKYALLELDERADSQTYVSMHDLLRLFAKNMAEKTDSSLFEIHRNLLKNYAEAMDLQFENGEGYVLSSTRDWWSLSSDDFMVDMVCGFLAAADLIPELLALITSFRFIQFRVERNRYGTFNFQADCFAVTDPKWERQVNDLVRAVNSSGGHYLAFRLIGWIGLCRLRSVPPERRTLTEAAAWSSSLHLEPSIVRPSLALPSLRARALEPIVKLKYRHKVETYHGPGNFIWLDGSLLSARGTGGGDVLWLESVQRIFSIANYGNVQLGNVSTGYSGVLWGMLTCDVNTRSLFTSTGNAHAALAALPSKVPKVPGSDAEIVAGAGTTVSLFRFWTEKDGEVEESPETFQVQQWTCREPVLKLCTLPNASHFFAVEARRSDGEKASGFDTIVVEALHLRNGGDDHGTNIESVLSITGSTLLRNTSGSRDTDSVTMLDVFGACAVLADRREDRSDAKKQNLETTAYVCIGINACQGQNMKKQYVVIFRKKDLPSLRVVELNMGVVTCMTDCGAKGRGRVLFGSSAGVFVMNVATGSISTHPDGRNAGDVTHMSWLPKRSRLCLLTKSGAVHVTRIARVDSQGRLSWVAEGDRAGVTVPCKVVHAFAAVGSFGRVAVLSDYHVEIYGSGPGVDEDEYTIRGCDGEEVRAVVALDRPEGPNREFVTLSMTDGRRNLRLWDAACGGACSKKRALSDISGSMDYTAAPMAWLCGPQHLLVGGIHELVGVVNVLSPTLEEAEGAIQTGLNGNVQWVVALSSREFACAVKGGTSVQVWKRGESQYDLVRENPVPCGLKMLLSCGKGGAYGVVGDKDLSIWDGMTGREVGNSRFKLDRYTFGECMVSDDVMAVANAKRGVMHAVRVKDGALLDDVHLSPFVERCVRVPMTNRIVVKYRGRSFEDLQMLELQGRKWKTCENLLFNELGDDVTALCCWRDRDGDCRLVIGHSDGSIASMLLE